MKYSKKNNKIIASQKWRHTHPLETRELAWGVCGFKILETLFLLRRRVFWLKRWLKWHYKSTFMHFKKKKLRRRRYYWFHIKRCIPCCRKSDKLRMGKGRGKLGSWFSHLNAGNFLFEFRYQKSRILKHLFQFFTHRFIVKLHLVYRNNLKTYSNVDGRTTHKTYNTRFDLLSVNRRYRHIRGYYTRRHANFFN